MKVLIIDDSHYMSQALTRVLESDEEIKVVAVAVDGEDALKKIEQHNPDVILFDIDMPGKEGPDVLAYLMTAHPVPVIILSRDSEADRKLAIRYLENGAVDFIEKPPAITYYDIDVIKNELLYKIKKTAGINLQKAAFPSYKKAGHQHIVSGIIQNMIVIIGASTGGPKAIETILAGLQGEIPASMIIVQHMGRKLIPAFAERLSWMSSFDVSVAGDNDVIAPGRIMVAPGGCNTIMVKEGDKVRIVIAERPKQFDDFPSIDITMKSAANAYGDGVIGVLLTGIGDDGVKGLMAIKEKGGITIVEEQSTCMVYGMPKAAIETGAADEIISLPFIAEAIMKKLGSVRSGHSSPSP